MVCDMSCQKGNNRDKKFVGYQKMTQMREET